MRLATPPLMPTYLLHLLVWWSLLAGLPLLWASRASSSMQRDDRVFRLAFLAAPVLFGFVWLHGVLLNSPSHWSKANPLHFFTLSFQPHDGAFYTQQQAWLLALAAFGVAVSALLTYIGVKSIEYAWNRRTAAISYALQICAWLLLRHLAEVLAELNFSDSLASASLLDLLASQGSRIAIAICVPLPFLAMAFMFARQSVERRARPPQQVHSFERPHSL